MFMTRLKLNASNRETMRAFASPSLFHGAVESAFSGERKRNLWRIDRLGGENFLMLLSEDMPDLSAAAGQFGYADSAWETKKYDSLLDRITNGGVWRFRLTANPTYSISGRGDDNKRGKLHAHSTVENQTEWLYKRSLSHGFELDRDKFTVTEIKWQIFDKKSGSRVRLLSVTFEGLLTVTDAELMRQTLTHGIGRGKAYGMGMMTIVRPNVNGDV